MNGLAEEAPSCLGVTPGSNNKLKATLAATITFDDTSTTRTEVSTDKELKRATTYLRNFQIIFRQLD